MGNRYLNKIEKAQVLALASFISFMDDRAIDWEAIGRPKDQVKYTKMAKAFAQKVLDFLCGDLEAEELYKLLGRRDSKGRKVVQGELDKMECVTRYKSEAVKEFEEMKRLDSVTPVETDDLLDIVTLALAS
jgi:hypothetical protein